MNAAANFNNLVAQDWQRGRDDICHTAGGMRDVLRKKNNCAVTRKTG